MRFDEIDPGSTCSGRAELPGPRSESTSRLAANVAGTRARLYHTGPDALII